MDWARLRRWYRRQGRHTLPWRHNPSPWGILLAETLLRRTRADLAARLYATLLAEFPDPLAVIRHPHRWQQLTAPLGLAWRAETFVRACETLLKEHTGEVPRNESALLALPGVGHYVARGVMCFGFRQRAVLVDTNTIRVSGRLSGRKADPARHRGHEVQQLVGRLGPGGRAPRGHDNFALLDLAALVCLPRDPLCHSCPVVGACATGRSRLSTAMPTMVAEPRVKRYRATGKPPRRRTGPI
jgi:A/G-specific adenine glycosylase